MKTWLRLGLLLAGAALLVLLARNADWPAIRDVFLKLGWLAPLALLPYLAVYLVDTVAWSLTLPRRGQPGFWRLFRLRWAGEAVNNLVPTGYIGGEAVKVYLLNQHGTGVSAGTVAAVVSKSAQTLAQVGFISLGALLFAQMPAVDGPLRAGMLGIAGLGLVFVIGFIALQRRGLSETLLAVFDRTGFRLRALERRRAHLLEVDHQIRSFYSQDRRRFLQSSGLFLAGWFLDSVEILVVGRWMGIPIDWSEALAIEAFIGVAKILGLLVPGALGVQETGVIMLCRLAGLPAPFGYAYALWRRFRELVYAGIGWGLLTAARTGHPPSTEGRT